MFTYNCFEHVTFLCQINNNKNKCFLFLMENWKDQLTLELINPSLINIEAINIMFLGINLW